MFGLQYFLRQAGVFGIPTNRDATKKSRAPRAKAICFAPVPIDWDWIAPLYSDKTRFVIGLLLLQPVGQGGVL